MAGRDSRTRLVHATGSASCGDSAQAKVAPAFRARTSR